MKLAKTPLEYFKALSAIPRVSGNEKAAADYVESVATAAGCQVLRDAMDNLVVKKAGSPGYESCPAFMLQGHLDMVGEKTPDSDHNFETDPIELVENGPYLRARNTTLGADDGVAVALMLTALTDEIPVHPPLECVFTVQEETGLHGAMALDPNWLTAGAMLNLDAGPEGIFVVSCAGGCRLCLEQAVDWTSSRYPVHCVAISGLSGGHSGSCIARQGANALVLAGILMDLLQEEGAQIGPVRGGEKDNVIPSSAEFWFAGPEALIPKLQEKAAELRDAWRQTDPNLSIVWSQSEPVQMLTPSSAEKLCTLLLNLPHGVVSRSLAMPDAIQTSANLARVQTLERQIQLQLSVRSASDFEKQLVCRRVERLAQQLGAVIAADGVYPGWNYEPDSELLERSIRAYSKIYGSKPKIEGIHAGLECGVFKQMLPRLEIVATGPMYGGMHTTDEWLELPSMDRTYQFVKELLRLYAEETKATGRACQEM